MVKKLVMMLVSLLLLVLIGSFILTGDAKEEQAEKIIKVGKYSIDTTKYKPNEKIQLRKEEKIVVENGRRMAKTYYENAIFSKNHEHVAIEYGVESLDIEAYHADYVGKWHLELYRGKNEKKLYKKIDLETERYPERSEFISNGYLLLETSELYGERFLEIYDPDGINIFKECLSIVKSYWVSPTEDYILITDRSENLNIYKFDLKIRKLNFLYKITNIGKIYSPSFSNDGKYYLIDEDIDKNNVKLYLFYNDKLLWEKEYTRKELAIDHMGPYLRFSNNAKYIIYQNGIIDIKDGRLIKKNITDNEKNAYEDEKI